MKRFTMVTVNTKSRINDYFCGSNIPMKTTVVECESQADADKWIGKKVDGIGYVVAMIEK